MGTIKGTNRNDVITGTKRDDYIEARDGDDVVDGGLGNDRNFGGNGDDDLYGGAGNDRLFGEAGSDELWGGDGDDTFQGGTGADIMYGGAGADNFSTTDGDITDGGDGDDEIMFLFNSTVKGGEGNDFFHFELGVGSGVTTISDYVAGEVLGLGYNFEANALLDGKQGWEFIGEGPPTALLTNGNGQATVSYADGTTILQLYHADNDLNADMTIILGRTLAAQDINLLHHGGTGWYDPALLFV